MKSCFMCHSTKDGSMNFVTFEHEMTLMRLATEQEITEAIKNNDNILEVRLCDECLAWLKQEAKVK